MRKGKQIIAALLTGAIVSSMAVSVNLGNMFGNIPAAVHAKEQEVLGWEQEADESIAAGTGFVDVENDKYYYRPVYWALDKNITTGISETNFGPNDYCTRAQTVTFLWRMAGEPEPQSMETDFKDVAAGSFYEKAVAWAVETGLTTGKSSTSFDPYGVCSRGEFVTFLYRMAGKPQVTDTNAGFVDVNGAQFYARPVAWAVENGVTTGTSATTFSPLDVCNRGQVVTFLHRWSTTLNVKDCGAVPNDGIDDTEAFNTAIKKAAEDEDVESVYVPAGTYGINASQGIKMKSNTNLRMSSDAVLDVSGNALGNYSVILIRKVQNVTISGGQIKGERYEHSGTDGEWGMGIGIYDSSNISISDMKISSNWGDGIYLGTVNDSDEYYGCNGVKINNCIIEDNRRSNISIVDASNVTINGCTISNANGIAPQCGINIEPNANDNGVIPADAICDNITITNTTINTLGKDDYWGQFFCFMTINYPDNSVKTANNIRIDGCTFNGDCGNYSGTNAVISNTTINGTFYDEQNTKLENVKYENFWSN